MRAVVLSVLVLALLLSACGDDAPVTAGDPERGAELFGSVCIACHGPGGQGSFQGPPLVHELYTPDVFDVEGFWTAIAEGKQQEHWSFGDMPRVGGIDRQGAADIAAYIHDQQRAAGLID